jgi:hypothetical protein
MCILCIYCFVSCTKKEQSNPDGGNSILSYSLHPGKDITSLNASAHLISVLVSDTVSQGMELPAYFTLSPGAGISLDGVNQESGITLNNFEKDLQYTVTASNQQSKQVWTVQAANNTYSHSYGLGHFLSTSVSDDRTYPWYIDQSTSGNFAAINCGPASVTMAIKWADSGFAKTALDARMTYEMSGGWWYTNDVEAYLSKYNISHAIIHLSGNADSTQRILTHQLDNHQIIILCLDMNFVRSSSADSFRVDKFYPTTPGWGHFIVLKGYKKVDGELFFEAYDPYSFGRINNDQTLKGMNRYYRSEDLASACLPWWNYAFVIAKKGQTLGLDAVKRKLIPAQVPVAHSRTQIF